MQIMRESYRLARDNLGYSAERCKHYYDMRVRPGRYTEGQWVYYYCPRRYVGRSPKWQRMYTGPYLITKVVGPVNVRLQATKRSVPFISHVDKLKPCFGDTPKSWLVTGATAGLVEEGVEDIVRGLEGVDLRPDWEDDTEGPGGSSGDDRFSPVRPGRVAPESSPVGSSASTPSSEDTSAANASGGGQEPVLRDGWRQGSQGVEPRARRETRRPKYLEDYA